MAVTDRQKWREWIINRDVTINGAAALASTLAVTGATTLASTLAVTGAATVSGNLVRAGANGSSVNLKVAEGSHTVVGGGQTETITNAIPAGALVFAVTARVTTIIVAATGVNWDFGVSGALTRFAADKAFAAGTTVTLADTVAASGPLYYQSATSILATLDAGTWTSGVIRWKVYYIDVTAPTG